MSAADKAIWFQRDAAYCYARVDQYRNNPAHAFIAVRVQQNAAESAATARGILNNIEGKK
jgi:hypothetical protein